ncbi:DNA cytosine methyltransferase [Salmonella enterica]|nr:DNA cytosine methyltransferase [Salmonella enterica]
MTDHHQDRVSSLPSHILTAPSAHKLLTHVATIYDLNDIASLLNEANGSCWTRDSLRRLIQGDSQDCRLNSVDTHSLQSLLPSRPAHYDRSHFRFVDLFAGIGGIRSGFEAIGGKCVLTSEWNRYSNRTYRANWYCDEEEHTFNSDIRDITLSNDHCVTEEQAYEHIASAMPDHDVLLAGFPCQPFSLAGVSKKNSMGRKHGFECETQGTLFFDVARIIKAKQPAIFVLENVKNLKSHDKGKTFSIIMSTLDELGYDVADADVSGASDPKVVDGQHFLPQHRERIVLVGFRRDLGLSQGFTLRDIETEYPTKKPMFKSLLETDIDDKYILSEKLWDYLYKYAKKHREKGNGFGYGLNNPENKNVISRTLSHRYHKDGSESLVDRGWDAKIGEIDFFNTENMARRPRKLTPRECARLMGFEQPGEYNFRIPVSDTQAYMQFGNSVIVPVFAAVARLLKSRIYQAVSLRQASNFEDAS